MEVACSPTTLSFVVAKVRDDDDAGAKAQVCDIAASTNVVAAIALVDRFGMVCSVI